MSYSNPLNHMKLGLVSFAVHDSNLPLNEDGSKPLKKHIKKAFVKNLFITRKDLEGNLVIQGIEYTPVLHYSLAEHLEQPEGYTLTINCIVSFQIHSNNERYAYIKEYEPHPSGFIVAPSPYVAERSN